VEFLVFYDQSQIREFGYVRRADGKDIPDAVYQALDDLGNGVGYGPNAMEKWQVRWRKRWSR
jgi:hypothetical protein